MTSSPPPVQKKPLSRGRQVALVLAAAALMAGGLFVYATWMFKLMQAPTLFILMYLPMAMLVLIGVNLFLGFRLRAVPQMALGTAVGLGLLWGAFQLWLSRI